MSSEIDLSDDEVLAGLEKACVRAHEEGGDAAEFMWIMAGVCRSYRGLVLMLDATGLAGHETVRKGCEWAHSQLGGVGSGQHFVVAHERPQEAQGGLKLAGDDGGAS